MATLEKQRDDEQDEFFDAVDDDYEEEELKKGVPKPFEIPRDMTVDKVRGDDSWKPSC
jgi:hypothetical protein